MYQSVSKFIQQMFFLSDHIITPSTKKLFKKIIEGKFLTQICVASFTELFDKCLYKIVHNL